MFALVSLTTRKSNFLITDKDQFYELVGMIDPPELSWASNAVDFSRTIVLWRN